MPRQGAVPLSNLVATWRALSAIAWPLQRGRTDGEASLDESVGAQPISRDNSLS
jgi:hypothetical protein